MSRGATHHVERKPLSAGRIPPNLRKEEENYLEVHDDDQSEFMCTSRLYTYSEDIDSVYRDNSDDAPVKDLG